MVELSKSRPKRDWPEKTGYITATTRPLNCLVFLLPIIVLHQVGVLIFAIYCPGGEPLINAAFGILRGILSLLGFNAFYLPGFLVIGSLLIWHWVKGYPWQVRARTILGMAIESFLFAWPVLVLGFVLGSAGPNAATMPSGISTNTAQTLPGQAVLMIGAGIYEELLFRLGMISLMALLLTKVGSLSKEYALLFAASASALLFGVYHFYFGPEPVPFDWPRFSFYFLGGVYFSGLYVLRGFGITVGAHIVYDLIVLFLPFIQQ
ncbi:MAG: CPBP family intramembrane metalloprotease [Actinobacteria bacterium]|nr:CPBP family intramembrane metalloprotease [Actinomycetota bacterium]